MKEEGIIILGAGITGLAAGIKTGYPIYEAKSFSGGLCSSYEISGTKFERVGGHWIFRDDQEITNFINRLSPLNFYERKAAVYFSKSDLFVPYPLQNHLSFLPKNIQQRITQEKIIPQNSKTQKEWLRTRFGETLCDLFFFPFQERYTVGLYKTISPQDKFKNPRQSSQGYNSTFAYPKKGLGDLITKMSKKSKIHFNKKVAAINLAQQNISFTDGSKIKYEKIFSSIPLNKMVRLCQLKIAEKEDPYTSVLIVNILAKKGLKCPKEHWLYLPDSLSGFHRVGFYSNVDPLFLPPKKRGGYVSLYAEKAFLGGEKISKPEIEKSQKKIIRELTDWQFIEKPEIIDSNWVETAYSWQFPNSCWKDIALDKLKKANIIQIGRYGQWRFQGIADSIREGFSL